MRCRTKCVNKGENDECLWSYSYCRSFCTFIEPLTEYANDIVDSVDGSMRPFTNAHEGLDV